MKPDTNGVLGYVWVLLGDFRKYRSPVPQVVSEVKAVLSGI